MKMPPPQRPLPGRRIVRHAAGSLAIAVLSTASCLAAPGGTCTIIVSAPGILAPNAALSSLSTKNPGGSPARVSVEARDSVCVPALPATCFHISVATPTTFTAAPPGGNGSVSIEGIVTLAGTSSLLNLASLLILNGTSVFDFNLTATKSTGVFATGTYQAQQTVRCE